MLVIIFFMAQNHKNLDLSEDLRFEKIREVGKPIEKAHGLPNECYTSDDYLTMKERRIFCDKWTVIGVGSSFQIWRCSTIQSTRDSSNYSKRQRYKD